MVASLKCRSKNPSLCVDPNCPEKQQSTSSLHSDFLERLANLKVETPVLDAKVLEAMGFLSKDRNGTRKHEAAKMRLLEDVRMSAERVTDDFSDLDIPNHANTGEDFLTLKDMADPILSRNNCWAVSSELIERVDPSDFGADELNMVSLKCKDEYHAAILLSVEGHDFVVDYTARQFEASLGFPYIAPLSQWEQRISPLMGEEITMFVGEYYEDEADKFEDSKQLG